MIDTIEKQTLAGFILEPDTIKEGLEDLFHARNKEAYRAIVRLKKKGEKIDACSVATELNQDGAFSFVGRIIDHLAHTKSKFIKQDVRDCIQKLYREETRGHIKQKIDAPFANMDDIRRDIEAIPKNCDDTPPGTVQGGVVALLDDTANSEKIAINLPSFNRAIGGFRKGELLTTMGRPTTWKTWILLNLVMDMAKTRRRVDLFSLEMPLMSITERLVELFFEVGRDDVVDTIKKNPIMMDEFKDYFDTLNIFTESQSVQSIQAKIEQTKPDIVIVDFFGLLKCNATTRSPYEKATTIITELKQMAKDCNVLLILAVQLSREAQDGSVPVKMSDARDSGTIEEMSDFIIGAWRPEIAEAHDPIDNKKIYLKLLKNKRGESMMRKFIYRENGKIVEEE